jgi:hypothetical protein
MQILKKLIEIENTATQNKTGFNNFYDKLNPMDILNEAFKNKSIPSLLTREMKFLNSRFQETSSIRILQNPNNKINSTTDNNRVKSNNSSSADVSEMKKISYEHMNFTICGSAICYDAGGTCLGIDKCECEPGYHDPKDNSIFKCTYKQLDARIAFLLEFFIGFGSGHFYAKRYFNGFLKFCVYLFLYLFAVVINLFFHYKRNRNEQEIMISSENPYCRFVRIVFMCSCFFTCIIWQISDSILFYSKFYNDGEDFPLYLNE